MIHLILVFVGVKSNAWAVLWGGFLSCLSMFGAGYSLVRSKNCEVKGCLRLAKHATAADHKVCRHHHPDDSPTHEQVKAAHLLASAPSVKADAD